MKSLFFLPLDLLYLTVDLWRIWLNSSAHGGTAKTDHLQACVFCHRVDAGDAPRKAPPGIRKYHNRWLIHAFQPCLRGIKGSASVHSVCEQEHMFVRYARTVPLAALILTLLWLALLTTALRWIFG